MCNTTSLPQLHRISRSGFVEAVVRNGVRVHRYYNYDISKPEQLVARQRIQVLPQQYPHQLPQNAMTQWDTLLMDVTTITSRHMHTASGGQPHQWLVVAGPECKDFSPVGYSLGWDGKH